jgi:hypothetical protein
VCVCVCVCVFIKICMMRAMCENYYLNLILEHFFLFLFFNLKDYTINESVIC